jgi:hypothetical protein
VPLEALEVGEALCVEDAMDVVVQRVHEAPFSFLLDLEYLYIEIL